MIQAIHTAPEPWALVQAQESVAVRAGGGIVGDRQATNITLIDIESCEREGLEPGASRRQFTVRGVDLNALVGKRFRVGSVLCEGTELCQPCAKLEKHLDRPGIVGRMRDQAGIRANVLEDGEIHVGDAITVEG
jgi:MOSC domain-containing protein YiiM